MELWKHGSWILAEGFNGVNTYMDAEVSFRKEPGRRITMVLSADTDYAFELAALREVTLFVCNQRSVVILQAGLKGYLQTFQELVAQRAIPVHIEMTEITVVVRILVVILVLVASLP